MKRLFLQFFAAAFLVSQVVASEHEFSLECEHVHPSEAIRMLQSLKASGVLMKQEGRKLVVAGGSPSIRKKIEEFMELVDVPRVTVRPRFIKLRFADVTHVEGVISQAFLARAGNEALPLQAVANLRTNEVFLMGSVKEMQAAESLVEMLDQAQTRERRACGEPGA